MAQNPPAEVHHNVETEDRGVFDFLKDKKEEKAQEEVIAAEMEKVHVSEPVPKLEEPKEEEEEKKHESLLEKFHRSDSSSSSSSEEEGEDGEKKKKKKKGLKEKVKETISGENKGEEDTTVPVEKCDEEPAVVAHPVDHPAEGEKKGFLEKIKDKLPGGQKKPEEDHVTVAPPPVVAVEAHHEAEASKEKKGILEKIKEKIPGYHPKEEEKKEEKEATHESH